MASVEVEAHLGMQMNTKPWVSETIIDFAFLVCAGHPGQVS
jgi:hypothetical protein